MSDEERFKLFESAGLYSRKERDRIRMECSVIYLFDNFCKLYFDREEKNVRINGALVGAIARAVDYDNRMGSFKNFLYAARDEGLKVL